MKSIVLIVLTAIMLLIRLGSQAAGAGSIRSVQGGTATAGVRTHPLVLLLGSLLSLMALYSLLRYLPSDVDDTWPVFFHVGFLCLWLTVIARVHAQAEDTKS
ncbi:MAG: hypothetical protein OEM62_05890 [Acidobacteriota bacterium]|nr:hypothetical protein [Acidobacteriota bacterium]